MLERITLTLFRYRTWLVLAWVGVLGALGYAAITGTAFTSDYRVYFAPDNPELLAYEAIERDFTSDDNVLIAIAPASGSVFTPEILSILEELTDAAWQIPHAHRVDSLINFQHTVAVDGDLIVGPLVDDAAELTDEDLR